MDSVIGVVVTIASFLFGLVFLINWMFFVKDVSAFRRTSLCVCAVYVALQVLLLLSLVASARTESQISVVNIIMMPVNTLKLYIIVIVGCYYARELSYPVFPLLNKRCKPDVEMYALPTGAVVVGASLYSYILFSITSTDILEQPIEPSSKSLLISTLTALSAALSEEVVFRLGVQNYLAKALRLRNSGHWMAIIAASLLWSMAHISSAEPYWIKFAQVFPIGLALGWLNRNLGIESAIVSHGLLNLLNRVIIIGLLAVS